MVSRRRRGHPQAPRRRRQRRPRRLHGLLQATLPRRAPPRPLRRGHYRATQPRRMTQTPGKKVLLKKIHPPGVHGKARVFSRHIHNEPKNFPTIHATADAAPSGATIHTGPFHGAPTNVTFVGVLSPGRRSYRPSRSASTWRSARSRRPRPTWSPVPSARWRAGVPTHLPYQLFAFSASSSGTATRYRPPSAVTSSLQQACASARDRQLRVHRNRHRHQIAVAIADMVKFTRLT